MSDRLTVTSVVK